MTRQIRVAACVLVLVAPGGATAGPGSDRRAADLSGPPDAEEAASRREIEAVMAELATLRTEVATLGARLAALEASTHVRFAVDGAPANAFHRAPPPASGANARRADVEQLQQDDAVQSPRRVRLFGAIVSNTVGNTGMANWLENPNIVEGTLDGLPAGSFTSTLRQSQIGLDVGSIAVGGLQVSGRLMADFMGGTPGFVTGTAMGLPRMIYAYARLEGHRTAVQVGQDRNLLAPRDPTSLAAQTFPLLFRAGNLHLRSPQVRLEHRVGRFALKGGLAAPLAGDANSFYTFAPPSGEGERSHRPALESRVDYAAGSAGGTGELTVGVSGRYGWRRPREGTTRAWSYAADFDARWKRLGAAGEFFRTVDAAEFGAAVAQAWPAHGGWIEGRFAVTPTLSANAGVGFDRVRDRVPAGSRQQNRSVFGNVIFDLTPDVAMSLEYRWLETTLGRSLQTRDNHHVNAAFVLRF